ncbi:MAG TPA: monovalent cation/H+ antiporter subunit D [Gammaproteobacteria bacterium]
MSALLQHLPVLPIVIPLLAGAVMLLLPEARRTLRSTIAVASMAAQLAAALTLLYLTSDFAPDVWTDGIGVYAIGNWPAPFGILLVVDRLAALMLTLGATVSLATVVYSIARWDRPGQPFHSLLQFLAMGLNGAFLTGDLFNLFVFFEVLLAASYGLVLRGLGATRVREGFHYIAVNLVASFLFLIGVAMIYGIVGTLNMADLARRFPGLDPADRSLFDAGAAILGIAFLIKAAAWPLNFWLPGAYSAATAPVAASFTMLTKLGVYAALRVGTLMSEDQAAASMLGSALFYVGLATLVAGTIGMLAAQHLPRLVSHTVIVSTGILLAALGLGMEALTAPVLFYLITSVLTTATFFMLAGMTERTRVLATAATPAPPPEPPSPFYEAFGVREPDPYSTDDEVGIAIPRAVAFLGLVFVCCVLLVTGLPPLPGFVAKLAMLATALAQAPAADASVPAWSFTAAVLVTGFVGLAALTRVGIRLFWTVTARATPRLRVVEAAPVAVLVLAALWLGAEAGPVMEYLETAARSLHEPQSYIRAVLTPNLGPLHEAR